MNFKHIALGLALLVPSLAYSTDASAGDDYAKCENKKDEKKKAKCNKNYAKWLKKNKAKTTPYVPSNLNSEFAALDAEDKNPFASDNFWFGTQETGIEGVDALLGEIYKAQAAVKMANYVGYLHKHDQKDEAKKYGATILPELIALKEIVPTLQEKLQGTIKDLQKDPIGNAAALKVLPGVIAELGKTVTELPKVVTAITPIAKGAPGAAADMAGDAVKKKMGGK